MKRFILACCVVGLGFVLPTQSAKAADLIWDATITRVSNTRSNQPYFAVFSATGSGPCVGQWIRFPVTAAGDYNAGTDTSEMQRRAYATALLAYTGGYKVYIYNFTSNACDGASFIEIYK